jgi:beta-lactamase regulating signal transducer with metallopeptidase domain
MKIIGEVFSCILFLSMTGTLFILPCWVLRRFARASSYVYSNLLCLFFFLVPILYPTLSMFSPEEPQWVSSYQTAAWIWGIGAAVTSIIYTFLTLFSYLRIGRMEVCRDKRILAIYENVIRGSKNAPLLLSGDIAFPIGIAGLFRPRIVMNPTLLENLSDRQIYLILLHEMTHQKRGHLLIMKIMEIAAILHWFNPFIYLLKKWVAEDSEMDCDRFCISDTQRKETAGEYGDALIRLLTVTNTRSFQGGAQLHATGYRAMDRRIRGLFEHGRTRKAIPALIAVILLALMVAVTALAISRTYFYPYPGLSVAIVSKEFS